jgi:hypothetical protein
VTLSPRKYCRRRGQPRHNHSSLWADPIPNCSPAHPQPPHHGNGLSPLCRNHARARRLQASLSKVGRNPRKGHGRDQRRLSCGWSAGIARLQVGQEAVNPAVVGQRLLAAGPRSHFFLLSDAITCLGWPNRATCCESDESHTRSQPNCLRDTSCTSSRCRKDTAHSFQFLCPLVGAFLRRSAADLARKSP